MQLSRHSSKLCKSVDILSFASPEQIAVAVKCDHLRRATTIAMMVSPPTSSWLEVRGAWRLNIFLRPLYTSTGFRME